MKNRLQGWLAKLRIMRRLLRVEDYLAGRVHPLVACFDCGVVMDITHKKCQFYPSKAIARCAWCCKTLAARQDYNDEIKPKPRKQPVGEVLRKEA